MAIYYMTMSVMSGNKGQSAVAHSAYQSGDRLHDDADGLTKNYARKERVVATGIAVPDHAPAWAHDRERLWNEVEKIEGARGRYARNWVFALPNELTQAQQQELVSAFIKKEFVDRGMVADWAIHQADKDNDADNAHVHIMTTVRPFEKDGTWGQKSHSIMERDKNGKLIFTKRDSKNRKQYKKRKVCTTDWNEKSTLLSIRHGWAVVTNRALEAAGYDERIDERSYAERGIDKLPQIHLGHAAAGMERRGERSRLGDINRAVAEINAERSKTKATAAATAARTPVTPSVDPIGTTDSPQPKRSERPAPTFSLPSQLDERMPFLFELQERLRMEKNALSKKVMQGIKHADLRAKANASVPESDEMKAIEKRIKELDTLTKQNEKRSKEVADLLKGEYRKANAPTLWQIIKGTRNGTEWNAKRDALIAERNALTTDSESMKDESFKLGRQREQLGTDRMRACDDVYHKLVDAERATMPEQAAADRADRAVKAIAKEIRTTRERGADLAGKRSKAFTARYDGQCHAVQARANTTPPTASMASIVKAITDGSLPASQISMRTDDDGLRNWSLMTELERDEELNKEMWKSI